MSFCHQQLLGLIPAVQGGMSGPDKASGPRWLGRHRAAIEGLSCCAGGTGAPPVPGAKRGSKCGCRGAGLSLVVRQVVQTSPVSSSSRKTARLKGSAGVFYWAEAAALGSVSGAAPCGGSASREAFAKYFSASSCPVPKSLP